jgi:hypothetical protein
VLEVRQPIGIIGTEKRAVPLGGPFLQNIFRNGLQTDAKFEDSVLGR